MASRTRLLHLQQNLGAQKAFVKDSKRVIGDGLQQLPGIAHLVGAVFAKDGITQKVRAQ